MDAIIGTVAPASASAVAAVPRTSWKFNSSIPAAPQSSRQHSLKYRFLKDHLRTVIRISGPLRVRLSRCLRSSTGQGVLIEAPVLLVRFCRRRLTTRSRCVLRAHDGLRSSAVQSIIPMAAEKNA